MLAPAPVDNTVPTLTAPGPASVPFGSSTAPEFTGGLATLVLPVGCTATTGYTDSAVNVEVCPPFFERTFTAVGTGECSSVSLSATQLISLTDAVAPTITTSDTSATCAAYAAGFTSVATAADNTGCTVDLSSADTVTTTSGCVSSVAVRAFGPLLTRSV
jgi:hypothetical protein